MSTKVITITQHGEWKKTNAFLQFIKEMRVYNILNSYGEKGVQALSAATPKRTGETAASWYYEVVANENEVGLEWHNSKMGNDGKTPVVMLIQLGHGTRTGGYVPPNDFINPAIKTICDEAADAVWKVVTSA